MSEVRESVTDLFHSCKWCACNVKSLHPSRFAKNRGSVRGAGCLLGSKEATVTPPFL